MHDESDPFIQQCLLSAFQRFDENLRAALPRTTPHLLQYLQGVPTRPEQIFDVRNFPHFLLPYWFSPRAEKVADAEFQIDLLYSSINGYYFIRLCDNIADNDSRQELRKLAPCTLYFDSEAIRPYRKYFPTAHKFWNLFDGLLAQQAEASAADGLLEDVDAETFACLSSRKFTGTKIPMSAVRFRYRGLESEFEQWLRLVDCLGNFAQFSNDFFDWHHDPTFGIITYLSSEWRRRAPGDSVTTWFLREGFDWGVAELKSRFHNVTIQSQALRNDAVMDWVIRRGRALDDDIDKVRSGLKLLKTFGRIISGNKLDGGTHGHHSPSK
jgi:hypothetical protein